MNPVLPCCVLAGVGRMEVKIEPDRCHVTECLYDDKPGTGMFDILMLAEFSVIVCLVTCVCILRVLMLLFHIFS